MKMKLTRKLLSSFLSVIMILSMSPMNTFITATADTTDEQNYDIWVGSEQLTDSNLTITDTNGGTATYDPDTNTLTLTDFTWSGNGHNYSAIYAGGSLNLVLVGSNTVTQTNGDKKNSGLYIYEDLTVSGSGSLTCIGANVTGNPALPQSFGVNVGGNITIQSGNLIGTAGKVDTRLTITGLSSYGVCGSKSITITGGSLTGTGGTTNANYGKSYGVFTYMNITVSNGSLTGIGQAATGDYSTSYGVHVNRSDNKILMNENSHIKAKGDDYAVYNMNRADGYYRTSESGSFRKGFTSSGTFIEFITKDHAEIKTQDDHLNHTLNCKGNCDLKINEQKPTGSIQYTGSDNKIAKTCSFCGEVGSITISAPADLIYDGNTKPVTYKDSGELENSNLTICYKETQSEDNTSTIPPTDSGTYTASVTYSVNDVSYVASVNYEIQKRSLAITAKDQEITYGDNIATGVGQVTISSLLDGDTLTDITLSESTKDVPGGTITPYNAVIKNTANKDVSSNYDITYSPGTLTIKEKKMTAEVSTYTGTYDGAAHTITVTPSEVDATIKYGTTEGSYDQDTAPTYTNAGTYTVYYKVTKPNYTTVTGSSTVTINQIVVNVTVEEIDDQIYTGSSITPEVTITPEAGKMVDGEILVPDKDYTVSYSDNNTDVGTVNVTINSIEGSNYTVSGSGSFKIIQATNEWLTEPSISDWTYGKDANTPTYDAKFGAVSIKYSGTANDSTAWDSETAPTKAGNYTVTFTVMGNDNYTALIKEVPFTIAKADYDMSGAKWNYTDAFDYDGLEKSVAVADLPSGVTVSSYEGNKATVVGDYTAKVTFSYDSYNYNLPVLADLNWRIKNEWTPTEYTVSTLNANGWLNSHFVITSADGYKVSIENTADGTWSDYLTYKEETANGSVTFYLKNESDSTISLAKTVTYKIDTTPATGTVEFVDRSSWGDFVNAITFGLFYKDEVTVKAEATDNENGSGIASIEYAVLSKAMTLDEVKEITTWETMPENGVGVTLEDAKQFIYFIRITDNAGNVTYLSTNGAEYDITSPAIIGVENGKTYYATQNVTITDKNIENITLNGEQATESITLEGNKHATYTIVATDKAGNSTTVTITMKPIIETADSYDFATVSSDDKADLEQLLADIEKQLESTNLTYDEKKSLEDTKLKVDILLDIIEKGGLLYGDVDCNDDVNMSDVVSLQKIIAKLKEHSDYSEFSEVQADVTHDGVINLKDVVKIQRYIARLITTLEA